MLPTFVIPPRKPATLAAVSVVIWPVKLPSPYWVIMSGSYRHVIDQRRVLLRVFKISLVARSLMASCCSTERPSGIGEGH